LFSEAGNHRTSAIQHISKPNHDKFGFMSLYL
jgi:hypothetical protein